MLLEASLFRGGVEVGGGKVAGWRGGGQPFRARRFTYDLWLIKTDSEGNKEWGKRLGNSNFDDSGKSVQQTADGGYIVCGQKQRG